VQNNPAPPQKAGMTEISEKISQSVSTGFSLTVSEDRLQVILSCSQERLRNTNLAAEIQAELKQMGITAELDNEGLRMAIENAIAENKEIKNITIARGITSVPPEDGRLEWTGDYFTQGYFVDPITGRIDFHQKIEQRAVEKGQMLVKVIPPRDGKDGADVCGRPIKIARPRAADIKGGTNVAWDDKELGYRANCTGRVRMMGRILEIDEVYLVRGDIGKDTGNINHSGQLVIEGNIESDFKVEASGHIEVRGLIYACDIKCGGNLIAREGINENQTKRIAVGGDIAAKYILNANIICNGNILTKSEIFQSIVKAKGEVNCAEGRLVGGEIMSAKGITAKEAGSKGNVKTTLVAGVDFALMDKLKNNNDNIQKSKDAIKKLTPACRKLKTSPITLSAVQKENLMEMEYQVVEAEEQITNLEEENKTIRREIYSNKTARVKILGILYPGVTIRIFDSQYTADQPLMGPLVAALDRITGELALSAETNDNK
jgi:uncharacterized protein (DUF342 family)